MGLFVCLYVDQIWSDLSWFIIRNWSLRNLASIHGKDLLFAFFLSKVGVADLLMQLSGSRVS